MIKYVAGVLYEHAEIKHLTSWRIGGCVRYLYVPKDERDLSIFLREFKKDIPIMFLGLGSNCLLYDGQISACLILLRNTFKTFQFDLDNKKVIVSAGLPCPTLARKASKLGFNHLNFLSGIPGSIGGALFMNAGAFDCEIWQYILSVKIIDQKGQITTKTKDEFEISYRDITGLKKSEFFIEASLDLNIKNDEIYQSLETLQSLLDKRYQSQPVNLASCGSVFKNPENDYAARLIESCSLKGFSIGGAEISKKHANFIINKDNATYDDTLNLIKYASKMVFEKHNIYLQPEVKIIGADGGYQTIW